MTKPAFLITIDTEGDNLWTKPRTVTTENAAYLPRFQELCERYNFKPTWLADWDMAHNEAFIEFGRDVVARGAGEVGMHLHAWRTPPLRPITPDDLYYCPYLTEYPADVIAEKIHVMTSVLEDAFGTRIVSHRAGRWGFDEVYARALVARGYLVDCSVTPHVSWTAMTGAPSGQGGPDFRRFPDRAYFVDLDEIWRPGNSPLLEVPVTVLPPRRIPGSEQMRAMLSRLPLGKSIAKMLFLPPRWLRPSVVDSTIDVLRQARRHGLGDVEFMQHSSEFMPAGSPFYPDAPSIEQLFDSLEQLFAEAARAYEGVTLAEYRQCWARNAQDGAADC